jgi:hypothetical protein
MKAIFIPFVFILVLFMGCNDDKRSQDRRMQQQQEKGVTSDVERYLEQNHADKVEKASESKAGRR